MSVSNFDNFPKKSQSKIKSGLDFFGSNRDHIPVSFEKYTFVSKSLIFSLIYFIFTILFLIISAIIGVMIGYFLKQYDMIESVLRWQLWQKILFFGGFLFLIANFCLFEAESIVKTIIKERDREKSDDLRTFLKIRPKSWQKVFYSMLLIGFAVIIGYIAVINYINWNYNQFWE
jgi:MFS family permease